MTTQKNNSNGGEMNQYGTSGLDLDEIFKGDLSLDKQLVEKTLMRARIINLYEEIDNESIELVIAKMYAMQMDNSSLPITINIDSPGGVASAGLWLADEIEHSSTPIITCCTGSAASAAGVVFLAGHIRLIHKHATVMIHSITGFASGTLKNIDSQHKHASELENMLFDFYKTHTDISEDTLKNTLVNNSEIYLLGEKAVEQGCADQLYNGRVFTPRQIVVPISSPGPIVDQKIMDKIQKKRSESEDKLIKETEAIIDKLYPEDNTKDDEDNKINNLAENSEINIDAIDNFIEENEVDIVKDRMSHRPRRYVRNFRRRRRRRV